MKLDRSAKLLLIGSGVEKSKIIEYVEMKNYSASIIFIDKTTDMQGYYSASDIFSFPSKWESLGMVVVEAQIAGLPCLVSKHVPKITEVSDKVMFSDIDDKKEWAKLLFKINENRKNIVRKTVLDTRMKQFDIRENVNNLLEIYKKIDGEKNEE